MSLFFRFVSSFGGFISCLFYSISHIGNLSYSGGNLKTGFRRMDSHFFHLKPNFWRLRFDVGKMPSLFWCLEWDGCCLVVCGGYRKGSPHRINETHSKVPSSYVCKKVKELVLYRIINLKEIKRKEQHNHPSLGQQPVRNASTFLFSTTAWTVH